MYRIEWPFAYIYTQLEKKVLSHSSQNMNNSTYVVLFLKIKRELNF